MKSKQTFLSVFSSKSPKIGSNESLIEECYFLDKFLLAYCWQKMNDKIQN